MASNIVPESAGAPGEPSRSEAKAVGKSLPSAWRPGEDALIERYDGRRLKKPVLVKLEDNGLRLFNGEKRTWYATTAARLQTSAYRTHAGWNRSCCPW